MVEGVFSRCCRDAQMYGCGLICGRLAKRHRAEVQIIVHWGEVLFSRVPSKILMQVAYTYIHIVCISQRMFKWMIVKFEQYSSDLWLLGLSSAFSCTK